MLDKWFYDLRSSWSALIKSPIASIAAMLLIAFGIGINATVYSIADGFLRRPAAGVPENDRLVLLMHTNENGSDPATSYPNYLDYVNQTQTLQGLFAQGAAPERVTITLPNGSKTDELFAASVTPGYFQTLRLPLAKGRGFTEDEGGASAPGLVAVISYRLWQEQFEGAADVVGRHILVNDYSGTVIGVAPPRFRGLTMAERFDVWLPLVNYTRLKGNEATLNVRKTEMGESAVGVYGELRPGISLAQGQADLRTISQRLQASYPDSNKDKTAFLESYSAGAGPSHNQEVVLFNVLKATVLMVLLIVCANVANLMLLRGIFRQRDYAVRQVLGASRGRIFRMLTLEGLLLSCTALIPAYFFAAWASGAAVRLIPRGPGEVINFSPDWHTAIYAIILALASTLVFMALPVMRVFRRNLVGPLKAASATGRDAGRSRLPLVLVGAQLALSCALLINFALVQRFSAAVRTFISKNDYSDVLSVDLTTQASAHSPQENRILLNRLYDRFSAIPGVEMVSYSQERPIEAVPLQPVTLDRSQQPVRVMGNVVGPDYLRILGVQGLLGRDVSAQDREGMPKAAIINQNLARNLWHEQTAPGRTILVGDDLVQVVGIVPNGVLPGLDYHPEVNVVFLPERQNPFASGSLAFYLRCSGNQGPIVSALRGALQDTDSGLEITGMQSMARMVESITGPLILISSLLFVFATGAFVIGAIGLFTVIAYQISSRTREFGLCLALGSTPRRLINRQLKKGLVLALIGSGIGLVLSFVIGRFLRHAVFGLSGTSGTSAYLIVVCLLTVIAMLAYYLPTRKAAHMNPMEALRDE